MTDANMATRPRGKLDEADLLVTQCLIGGAWTAGERARIRVDDPFTLDIVAEVPDLDAADTARAIDAAGAAFPAWAARPARERSQALRRWLDLIIRHKEDLARLIVLENGKALAEARGEVDYAAGFVEFYVEQGSRSLGEIIPAPVEGRRLLVEREPVGVCAAITPWNFPLAMLTRKVAPALAAGCTIVAKPSELTPLTALAYAKLGEEAGLPAGVFNVITGDAAPIGDTLCASATVRKLSFTGSTRIGALLAAACAPTIKRLGLELGGNAPLIVYDDADLEKAVDTAMVAKFRNGGQSCIAANRIYVQSGIRDRFVAALAAKVQALRAGDGFDPDTSIGPLINPAAVAKVTAHRDDALGQGARVVAQGSAPEDHARIVAPTMLADVPTDALLTREETFGPLAAIIGFDTVEQSLSLANDTPFGLATYLCSEDLALIARVSRGLEAGMVGINTGLISTAVAPFGGVKLSGLGREGSAHGLSEYQNLKYICQAGL
ncbi:NAD-dependent succinate-semialdehyde dehydrogenase [Sphingomonas sp. Mn802worker]|uniref:NAD-dependent succinate-semialdehyde dehydrogenase n=1 Tax=Sphingomonas sp. Mn802worker TaxID=629773 RepID=UPI001EE75C53|nr:NAD-dependent succinate-semialdehyde dehydrogenase [Sphingomonas sp. Mn802worker]